MKRWIARSSWRNLALAAALVTCAASTARAETWKLDPAHSKVTFKVRHLMISNVEGRFKTVEATVEGDAAKPESATVSASIDVASIDTGNDKRDDHLRSPDFFDAAKFPTITFKSKQIRNWTGTGFEVVGDLTMHGVTKEVVLAVTDLSPEIKDPMGHARRGLTATTTIDRTDFGVAWNKALEGGGLTVGNEVKITLDVELTKQG